MKNFFSIKKITLTEVLVKNYGHFRCTGMECAEMSTGLKKVKKNKNFFSKKIDGKMVVT